jgi:hypothetical protein
MTIRHLSKKDIKEIRDRYNAPTRFAPNGRREYISMEKLARFYCVSQGTIQKIIDKKGRWADENSKAER